jgi:hypothetical protein
MSKSKRVTDSVAFTLFYTETPLTVAHLFRATAICRFLFLFLSLLLLII